MISSSVLVATFLPSKQATPAASPGPQFCLRQQAVRNTKSQPALTRWISSADNLGHPVLIESLLTIPLGVRAI